MQARIPVPPPHAGVVPGALALPRPRRRRVDVLVLRRKAERLFLNVFTYLMLVDVAFVFLFPLIYMIATSVKSAQDLTDPTVYWLARDPQWGNYCFAFKSLEFDKFLMGFLNWCGTAQEAAMYPTATATTTSAVRVYKPGAPFTGSFWNSTFISVGSAIGQTLSCAFVGYGFGRVRFPGRNLLFGLVLFSFLVPPETIIVPLFILYKNLGWIDTYWPFIVPSFFGMGLKGALFVIIFRQFFRGLPWELEEAARIDGAGAIQTFLRIMLPLARPAIIVVFLFSLVWHWNDYFEPLIYLNRREHFTLPMRLSVLQATLNELTGGQGDAVFNEALIMAACVLIILPPLVVYFFTQRYFIESIDRTGLVD